MMLEDGLSEGKDASQGKVGETVTGDMGGWVVFLRAVQHCHLAMSVGQQQDLILLLVAPSCRLTPGSPRCLVWSDNRGSQTNHKLYQVSIRNNL